MNDVSTDWSVFHILVFTEVELLNWTIDQLSVTDQRSVNRDAADRWTFSSFYCQKIFAAVYRRRPRRPPFLLVESDGIGVTSSDHTNEEETNKQTNRRSNVWSLWLTHSVFVFFCIFVLIYNQFDFHILTKSSTVKCSKNVPTDLKHLNILLQRRVSCSPISWSCSAVWESNWSENRNTPTALMSPLPRRRDG